MKQWSHRTLNVNYNGGRAHEYYAESSKRAMTQSERCNKARRRASPNMDGRKPSQPKTTPTSTWKPARGYAGAQVAITQPSWALRKRTWKSSLRSALF